MNKLLSVLLLIGLTACQAQEPTADQKDSKQVQSQQAQYAKGQPIPVFDWSLERDLVIQLYQVRNQKVSTHSVWRSDRGMIEGDCSSFGYGIPYDTSLTNPLKSVDRANNRSVGDGIDYSLTSIEQPEPNGIYASKNTNATWVMCLGDAGTIEPVYVETKVTVYPYPVKVDYKTNTAKKSGKATVVITKK